MELQERYLSALRLCVAFWPGRWGDVTIAAAVEMWALLPADNLPSRLDDIEHAMRGIVSESGCFAIA